jgi:hypothetical protein
MSNTIERQIVLNASRTDVWLALQNYVVFSEWFNAKFNEPFAVGKLAHGQIMYPGYEHVTIKMLIDTIESQNILHLDGIHMQWIWIKIILQKHIPLWNLD